MRLVSSDRGNDVRSLELIRLSREPSRLRMVRACCLGLMLNRAAAIGPQGSPRPAAASCELVALSHRGRAGAALSSRVRREPAARRAGRRPARRDGPDGPRQGSAAPEREPSLVACPCRDGGRDRDRAGAPRDARRPRRNPARGEPSVSSPVRVRYCPRFPLSNRRTPLGEPRLCVPRLGTGSRFRRCQRWALRT